MVSICSLLGHNDAEPYKWQESSYFSKFKNLCNQTLNLSLSKETEEKYDEIENSIRVIRNIIVHNGGWLDESEKEEKDCLPFLLKEKLANKINIPHKSSKTGRTRIGYYEIVLDRDFLLKVKLIFVNFFNSLYSDTKVAVKNKLK